MTEIHELSALELAAAVRAGETSPHDVLDHVLERAERLGPMVGAFVTLTPELARRDADAVTARIEESKQRESPLLGVPCPIKDLTMVAGAPTRVGSAAVEDVTAEVDDGVVTLLRGAGTLMLGKSNTPEFGLPAYTEPAIAPPARSPWDTRRSAGGSSGGAAAAVAAGIAPIAHGSDGGGSIRIPASACGLVGLKPSRGRVSPGPYGVDGAGFAVHGLLTRDVRDTAAGLDVLARAWPGDTYTLPPPRTSFLDACDRDPGRLRIGVLTQPVITDADVHPECLTAVRETAALLEDLGHHVDTAPVPFPAQRWSSFEALWSVLALTAPVPPEAEDRLTPLTRWLRDAGRTVSGLKYAQAFNTVQLITREAAATWAAYDVVLSPTLAQPPAWVGQLRDDDDPAADFAAQMAYTPWTSVWNITGWPAVSLPLHWASVGPADPVSGADNPASDPHHSLGGLADTPQPIGVMLGGRLGAEEDLLSLSAQLEEARPWRHRRPPIW